MVATMEARWIDEFSVMLLDMNGTFMFGHDRFGPEEDYFLTYRQVGGTALERNQVQSIMERTFSVLLAKYEDPTRCDDFPRLADIFRDHGGAPTEEVPLLERTFAAHEMGHVPPECAAFLRAAATTHHLGIVSNLWARPEPWLEALRHNGVLPLFSTLVFSSHGHSIKPSRLLFERAQATLPRGASVLFVGDDLHRDIIPAKAMGWATAWIASAGSEHRDADVVVPSLSDLGSVVATS